MSSFQQNFQLIIKATVVGNAGQTKTINNVLNYGTTSSVTKNISTFLTSWRSAYDALWLAMKDYTCILTDYVAKDLDDPLKASLEVPVTTHGTYNMSPGAPAPSINAAFVFLKSFASGRSSHGGLHLGGLPLAGIVGNEFTSGYQTIVNNFLTPYLIGFTDGASILWQPMIMSRKESSLTPPPPIVNVVGLLVSSQRSFLDTDVGTMRRRKERTVR